MAGSRPRDQYMWYQVVRQYPCRLQLHLEQSGFIVRGTPDAPLAYHQTNPSDYSNI